MPTPKARYKMAGAVLAVAIIFAILLPSSYFESCLQSVGLGNPFGPHPCPVENDRLAWRLAIALGGSALAAAIAFLRVGSSSRRASDSN